MRSRLCLLAIAVAAMAAIGTRVLADDGPKKPVVVLDTTLGKIEVELDAEKAPITVKNFLAYVEDKHYDGTVFHRVIKDFMIQGGGHDADLKEKPTRPQIRNESANGLKNLKGTIAMARKMAPDSATSQFFINVEDNPFLDRDDTQSKAGYAVFGKVVAGMDVVEKIRNVKTANKPTFVLDGEGKHVQIPGQNVPVEPVVINTARLKQ